MVLTPFLRKLSLTAHVATSVGWLGAVAAFLVLSIVGVASRSADAVRAVYLAMNLVGLYAIVPLSLASLLTGLVQSLGTQWGLLRNYWVVAKLLLTIGATVLLLLHQFVAISGAALKASQAAAGTWPDVGRLGPQLVADAALAVVVLLVNTTLSVFKPWGKTRRGRRLATDEPGAPAPPSNALKVALVLVGLLVLGFIVAHLAGGGLHGH